MIKLKEHIVVVAGLATLGVIGMFMSAHQLTAAPANPAPSFNIAGPLPLPVTGSVGLAGTAKVEQSGPWTVTTQDTYAPGRTATRIGPIDTEIFPASGIPIEVSLLPLVPTGQTFIVTDIHMVHFTNDSTRPLVTGSCNLRVTNANGASVAIIEMSGLQGKGNQEVFLPLKAGEGLGGLCVGSAADGTTPSQGFITTIGGYFVPAVQ